MGFLVGKIAWMKDMSPNRSGLLSMIVGHVEKNIGYFLYDYYLFGAVSILDLLTLFPKSIVEIVITSGLLVSIRRILKRDYLI
jgi:hypothetical protein